MKKVRYIISALIVFAVCGVGFADIVKTDDGAVLCGDIVKIHKGTIELKTAYAGTIKIKQKCVVSVSTDKPLNVRQKGLQKPVYQTIDTTTKPADISSVWLKTAKDPEGRNWDFSVGADLAGKEGNSKEFNVGAKFDVKLVGPIDRLRMYGEQHYSESNRVRSVDSSKLGVGYTRYVSQFWGWFVREEFERDAMKDMNLRLTTAAGATHAFIKQDHALLEGRFGLSYRFEDFTDKKDDGFFGLDIGLLANWKFAPWGEFNTEISYLPALDEFSNYLLSHDTGINFPLSYADNAWKLRLGLSQTFDSNTEPGRQKLDTTYYTRLLYEWK